MYYARRLFLLALNRSIQGALMKKLVNPPLATSLVVALSLLTTSCSKTGSDAAAPSTAPAVASASAPASPAAPAVDSKTAVCLYDGLGVRADVSKSSKFISTLFLGESVKWTGDAEKDENGKEYMKVELSDGKAGWVFSGGVELGAQMGAVREDAPTYKRPDPLTATGQKVAFMTIVAVKQRKDDWIELLGESKKQLGWVKKDVIALDKSDVTTAILATKKLREKDGLDYSRKVEAIAKASPNPSSYFIQVLREQAAAITTAVAVPVEAKPEAAVPAGESTAEPKK
jgi:hypothetical protein